MLKLKWNDVVVYDFFARAGYGNAKEHMAASRWNYCKISVAICGETLLIVFFPEEDNRLFKEQLHEAMEKLGISGNPWSGHDYIRRCRNEENWELLERTITEYQIHCPEVVEAAREVLRQMPWTLSQD